MACTSAYAYLDEDCPAFPRIVCIERFGGLLKSYHRKAA